MSDVASVMSTPTISPSSASDVTPLVSSMSLVLSSSKMTKKLPPVIYIRTQDSETLFAMHSHVFTESGTIPDNSLLRYAFSDVMKMQEPIYYQHNIPVFFIGVPSKIFQHMLTGFNMAHTWPILEKSLPRDIPQEIWQQYLDHYGLIFAPPPSTTFGDNADDQDTDLVWDDSKLDDNDEDDDNNNNDILRAARLKKKKRNLEQQQPKLTHKQTVVAKTKKMLMKNKDRPAWKYCERVARALAQYIRQNHPKWTRLTSGQSRHIDCHLVNTFETHSADGNHTFILPIPGDPPVDPVKVAYTVGFSFARNEWDNDSETKPSWYFFKACMADEWNYEQEVDYMMMDMDRRTRRKKPLDRLYWPAENVQLTPRHHDILRVKIQNLVD